MPTLANARRENLCQLIHRGDKTKAQCYLDAGYKANNLDTANSLVHRLLHNDDIKNRLRELKEEQAKVTLLDTEKVIEAITPIATSDMMTFLERRGGWYTLKSHEDLERLDTRAIKDIKMSTRIVKKDGEEQIVDQIVEIKLHDKNKTADMLLKWTGGYEQDNKQKAAVIVVAPSAGEE